MDYKTLDDKTLIALIVIQQADALSELYGRYNRLIFSLVSNMVDDHGAAEEITLDTFTRIWEKADTYRPDQAMVRTWMVSIVRYRAIDWLRGNKDAIHQDLINWAEMPSNMVPGIEGPEDDVLRRHIIHTAIAQLPPDQQHMLALAFFKGYTHSQIAKLTQEPLGTIKTRIRLGMQKLRQILHEEVEAQ